MSVLQMTSAYVANILTSVEVGPAIDKIGVEAVGGGIAVGKDKFDIIEFAEIEVPLRKY